MENSNRTPRQAATAVPTLSESPQNLPAFSREEKLTTAMLAPAYISKATESVRNVRDSVELVRSGKAYIPTVRQCVGELGRVPVTAMVKLQLVKLNAMMNWSRPLSDEMIEVFAPLIVDRIMSDDVSVNLADLRIIFENAAMGRYGKLYGGIGISDVISWIDQYIIDKCECIEEWHRKTFDEPVGERRAEDPKTIRDSFHQANVWLQMQKQNHDQDKTINNQRNNEERIN